MGKSSRSHEANTCYFCGKKLTMTPMPFECSYCGKIFCPNHRLPESHHCELDYKKKESKIEKARKRQRKGLDIIPSDWIDFGIRKPKRIKAKHIVLFGVLAIIAYLLYNGTLQEQFQNLTHSLENLEIGTLPQFTETWRRMPDYNISEMELNIHNLINNERAKEGLGELSWNDEVASVAREHSANLAQENVLTTDPSLLCPQIVIFHEGFDFGLYQDDRLNNRGVYYFGTSGENIFAEPMTNYKEYETYSDASHFCPISVKLIPLNPEQEVDPTSSVRREINDAIRNARDSRREEWTHIDWKSQNQMESEIVDGWMDSIGHRENILTEVYDETGIGISVVNDYMIITQVFIQRVDCGYFNASCCEEPGYYPYCHEPLECKNKVCVE